MKIKTVVMEMIVEDSYDYDGYEDKRRTMVVMMTNHHSSLCEWS